MEKTHVGQSGLLGRVYVAAPCPVSWDAMEGDGRVRFCGLCSLNVYNLSAMTGAEAEALVARAEGRLCARFYRRADGTVLTTDCPTGLRAVRRRVRRTAAAVFAAVVGLWTAAAGQTPAPKGAQDEPAVLSCEGGGQLKMRRRPAPAGGQATLSGVAQDPAGAFMPGVVVTLLNELTKEEARAVTDNAGAFSFARPAPGTYTLRLAAEGFKTQEVKGVAVTADESLSVESVMGLWLSEPLSGIVSLYPFIPPESSRRGNGTTVIDAKTIRSLPIP